MGDGLAGFGGGFFDGAAAGAVHLQVDRTGEECALQGLLGVGGESGADLDDATVLHEDALSLDELVVADEGGGS